MVQISRLYARIWHRAEDDINRFGVINMNEDGRIIDFEEKPLVAGTNTVSIGVYVIRRRQLIELLETCANEGRNDFVRDILVRYKGVKRIYGYKMDSYWRNIGTKESYYRANMDFLKKDVRDFFFKQHPVSTQEWMTPTSKVQCRCGGK